MTGPGATCQQVVELVSDYLDGLLDPDNAAAVAAHLEQCPGCREYVQQMQTTTGSLHDLPAEELDPDMTARLMAAFAAQQGPVSGR
jgi:anti-sigma factor RsiW